MYRYSFQRPGLGLCLVVAAMVAVAGNGTGFAQNLEPAPGTKAVAKPLDPSLEEIIDSPRLPNVLLIGDSISMGYTLDVRKKLWKRANVHHPAENCGPTERGLARLDVWLGTNNWDVIHFNFGLHDLKYLDDQGKYVEPAKGKQVAPPEVYGKNLRELAGRLQKTGAALIFATTTPVPPGTLGRIAGDERPYNEVALAVMKDLNIPVDDLGGYVAAQQAKLPPRPASEAPPAGKRAVSRPGEIQLPFNVHFTPAGYDQLSDLVVSNILKVLPPAKPLPPAYVPPPPKGKDKDQVKAKDKDNDAPRPPPDELHT
ncbi:MAG: SGNH/GDSL hydrolase family protein [Verrucomicrobiae bacterium]|nr:SGNH/GDSL hydrolase family protein [Verrucomicrobiae bacterium]